jgi:hypothetical protein
MAGDEGPMAAEAARVEPIRGEARQIEDLIAAGQHRDALAACARAYGLPLGRLCMAFTGSQAESEELVQETLLAAYDAFPQYRGDGSVRAWLFGIARRISGRHVEMRARRSSLLRLVHDTGRARDAGELGALVPRAGGGVRGGRGGGAQAGEPGAVAPPGGPGRGVGR